MNPLEEETRDREEREMQRYAERLGLGCEMCEHRREVMYRRIALPWCTRYDAPEDALIEDTQDPQCGYEEFSPTEEGWERMDNEWI